MIKQYKDIIIKKSDGSLTGFRDTVLSMSITSSRATVYLIVSLISGNTKISELFTLKFTEEGFRGEQTNRPAQEEYENRLAILEESNRTESEEKEYQDMLASPLEAEYNYFQKKSDLVKYLDMANFDLSEEGVSWLMGRSLFIDGENMGKVSDYFQKV